jgi:hypothetical protein
LTAWKNGELTRTPQGESDLPTFRVTSEEVMEVVFKMLEEHTYKDYVD